jgi:hypothetical protein
MFAASPSKARDSAMGGVKLRTQKCSEEQEYSSDCKLRAPHVLWDDHGRRDTELVLAHKSLRLGAHCMRSRSRMDHRATLVILSEGGNISCIRDLPHFSAAFGVYHFTLHDLAISRLELALNPLATSSLVYADVVYRRCHRRNLATSTLVPQAMKNIKRDFHRLGRHGTA